MPSPHLLPWKRPRDCHYLPFPGLSFRKGQEVVIARPLLTLSSEKPKWTLIAFPWLFNMANLAIYGYFVPFLEILAMLSFFPIVSVVFGRFDLLISIFCHFWLFLAILAILAILVILVIFAIYTNSIQFNPFLSIFITFLVIFIHF